jgi:predicted exporter
MRSAAILNFKGSKARLFFYIWIFLGGALIGNLYGQWQRGLQIDTDLLKLLPVTEQDAVVSHALDRFTRSLVRRHLFLIEHQDFAQASAAAEALNQALKASPHFTEVTGYLEQERERAFYELYFPYRLQLLQQENIDQLTRDHGATLASKAQQTLYSPMSSVVAPILDEDPLLTFPLFLEQLPQPPGVLAVKEGWLHGEMAGKHYILISAIGSQTIFSNARKELIGFIDRWQTALPEQVPQTQLYVFGMSRYTDRGEQQARTETSLIGGFSIAGVILLFLYVFRSPAPMLIGLLPIAFGLLTAVTLSFALFDSIHAITLGFGASLIGVCIDYTFHYFCDLWTHPPDEGGPLKYIFPAITFGAITSLLGYSAMFIAPFPGLQQMAIFSTTGLIGAYLTVVMAFPFLLRRQPKGFDHLNKARTWTKHWFRIFRKVPLGVWIAGTAVFIVVGLSKLQPNDDVRALQSPPEDLRLEEAKIREVAGNLDASRFLLVEGESQELLLQHLAEVEKRLVGLREQGALDFHQSIAPFLPSEAQQRLAWQALQDAWGKADSPLKVYLEEMGFEIEAQQALATNLTQFEPLTIASWLEHPASEGLRHLWVGATERGFAAMIILGGIRDATALAALEDQIPYVNYIDKVADISQLMQRYRLIAIQLIMAAYTVIFLLCCWRYGWMQAFGVVFPPILAALLVMAGFGLFNYQYSLFHILALLLVMGIGIDYTIFFAEAAKMKPTTMLAISLSSTTTILSFGLLALSGTALLSGFGLTVWVGITLAFLLAPIALLSKVPS